MLAVLLLLQIRSVQVMVMKSRSITEEMTLDACQPNIEPPISHVHLIHAVICKQVNTIINIASV
jgi:hypothetical protein